MGFFKRIMFGVFRATSGLKKSIVGKGHVSAKQRATARSNVKAKRDLKHRTRMAGFKYQMKKRGFAKVKGLAPFR